MSELAQAIDPQPADPIDPVKETDEQRIKREAAEKAAAEAEAKRLEQLAADKQSRKGELSARLAELAATAEATIDAADDTPASVADLLALAAKQTADGKLDALAESVERFRAHALNEVINPLRANGGDVPTLGEVFAAFVGGV